MTLRYSNSVFLTVLPALPLDNIGWEAVALDVDPLGGTTVMQRVYRFTTLSGAKVRNDFGVGSITMPKDDPMWTDPLPSPLVGVNPLSREFLWHFYEDGVLRHEFWGENIQEDIATDGDVPRFITISGRGVDACLDWGVHVPAWSEEQKILVPTTATGGAFQISYKGFWCGLLSAYATVEEVKAELLYLTGWDESDLEVIQTADDEHRIYTIRFVGRFLEGNHKPPEGFQMHDSGTIDSSFEHVETTVSEITQLDDHNIDTPQTAAKVFLDALARCQARGVLEFLTPLFTASVDSFGAPWLDSNVHEIAAGETLFGLLQRFAEAYGWEFRMLSNFQLQVVQTGFGLDRSGETRFWLGGHQQTHALNRTSMELRTRTWAQTDDNFIAMAEQDSSATWLSREAWVDGFAGGAEYAQVVANTTQTNRQAQVLQRTFKPPYAVDNCPRLFEDYTYCDWISVEDDHDVMHRLKIESVAWVVTADAPTEVEVVFHGNEPV